MPPLAHTNPWRVSVMTRPFSIRTTRFASRSTTSTWRASRPNCLAKATASGRGSMAEVDDCALGLRDDLLRHDEDIVLA